MEAFTNPMFLVNGPVPPGTAPEDAPPPPKPGPRRPTGAPQAAPAAGGESSGAGPPPPPRPRDGRAPLVGPDECLTRSAFGDAAVRPSGRGLAIEFVRRGTARVDVDVFRHSAGRTVVGERLVARFGNRTRSFRWSGRGTRRAAGDGAYTVRLRARTRTGATDTRRIALQRVRGRFRVRRAFDRREPCGAITSLKAVRPVFGGRRNRALDVSFRLDAGGGRVTVELLRGGRVVRRSGPADRRGAITHRVRFDAERLRRGEYRVRLTLRLGEPVVTRTIAVRRL